MSVAEANLRDAIERCYAAFADIPRPQVLHASPLRDADEILRTLTAAPLRDLTGEQVGPYSSWAITTVGDERDHRHFLPRILELSVYDPVWLGAEPPILASKLSMANWRSWPADQQSAVLRFFWSAFDLAIETHPDEFQFAAEWLCGLVSLGESPALIIERWLLASSPNAALQLASFIISEARNLYKHVDIRGPFWEDVDEDARRELASLLLSDPTKAFLQAAAARVSDDDKFNYIDAAFSELQRQF